MPETAQTPCQLPRLPAEPTAFDLETGYAVRGAAIVSCDAARQLAVDVHRAEHADEDAWLERVTPRPSLWRRLFGAAR